MYRHLFPTMALAMDRRAEKADNADTLSQKVTVSS
jgi:hypothetical protein